MDKRAKHSRDIIKSTFLELRAKKPLERITVTELCKIAQINKSTFYAHFHDIYDLSDYLETQLVEEIMADIKNPKNILLNKQEFLMEITKATIAHNDKILIIFEGNQSVHLPKRIYETCKKLISTYFPDMSESPEIDISLSHGVYGGFYAYQENLKYGTDVIVNTLKKIQKD